MSSETSLPDLAGKRLDEALKILETQGLTPEVIFSMPERMKKQDKVRTPRVVRFVDNKLLCSYFLDSSPEKPS